MIEVKRYANADGVMTELNYPQEYYQFWGVFMRLFFLLNELREMEVGDFNVPYQQRHVLSIIEHATRPTTPSRLARLMGRKNHTVSELISRMSKKGLIEKEFDKNNKSIINIKCTEKGKQIYEKTRNIYQIARVFSKLPIDEIERMTDDLKKLINSAVDAIGLAYMDDLKDVSWL